MPGGGSGSDTARDGPMVSMKSSSAPGISAYRARAPSIRTVRWKSSMCLHMGVALPSLRHGAGRDLARCGRADRRCGEMSGGYGGRLGERLGGRGQGADDGPEGCEDGEV